MMYDGDYVIMSRAYQVPESSLMVLTFPFVRTCFRGT